MYKGQEIWVVEDDGKGTVLACSQIKVLEVVTHFAAVGFPDNWVCSAVIDTETLKPCEKYSIGNASFFKTLEDAIAHIRAVGRGNVAVP
jgi:hypothetical protein